MLRRSSKARRARILVLCGLIGCASALISAWIPVLWWTANAELEPVWVDPETPGGSLDVDRFANPSWPRPDTRYELRDVMRGPMPGMRAVSTDFIDERDSFDQDACVIWCQSVRAGWPWTTMRGMVGTWTTGQSDDPDPSRKFEAASWALRLPLVWVGSPVRAQPVRYEPILPLRPTAGFLAHAGIVGVGLAGILLAAGSIRGRRRRARGACVSCGYRLEDLEVCPECGQSSG